MRPIRPRLAVSAVLVLCTSVASSPATGQTTPVEPYRAGDRSVVALNILPPGQGRYLNSAELLQSQGSGEPIHNRDQLPMYSSLIQSVPSLDEGKLDDLFKDASFGVKPGDIERQYEPRPGVVVLRDRSFGVPHIYGRTRSDTIFGAGYVTGEDRMFMIDVLRHVGRGRLTQLLGPSASNLAMDCAAWLSADYTEAELQGMRDRVPAGADPTLTALANQARQDVIDFTAGINQYINEAMSNPAKLPAEYSALQIAPSQWKVTDTVAVAALIGSQFGVGGGNELRNAFFLDALEGAGHSPAEARRIFDDFRFADDPEAPVTADGSFPWNVNLGPVNPASQAPPDPNSFQDADDQQGDSCSGIGGFEASQGAPATIDGPFGPIQLFQRRSASNALLVGPDLSKTGQPMAVFGPQVAYWSPEILMELDLHGPGIDARGVGFPGISMYVLLGRGDGYGYSATSAGGDLVDIRTVKLCDPLGLPTTINSTHYIRARDQACVPIVERTDTWLAKPTAGGAGLPETIEMTTERVELAESNGTGDLSGGKWGIVVGRGTSANDPVLFVQQRSTYGAEVDSAVTYVEIMNPDVINGPEDFHRAFGRFNYTFNWFYVDDHSIANQLVGAHPIRAQGTDIDLPYWDGQPWKWQGFLDFNGRPHVTNPAKGYITSWNNKQARGFRASDSNWSYGPVHRSQPLDDRILGAMQDDGKVDLVELVAAMGDAATVDIRGAKVLPYMLDVIGSSGGAQVQEAVALLRDWHEAGAHRRDQNGDGQYDHQAAVALMDAWWERALQAVFGGVLSSAFDLVPQQHHDAPGPVGSAFIGGWYGQLQKDLRSVLGQQPPGAFSRQYCGGGSLSVCRSQLASSLQGAINALGGAVGSWNYDESLDDIVFTPLGVNAEYRIPWQNRPTFQQVLQFGSPRGGSCGGAQTEGLTQILGTDGRDRLVGTSSSDVICAGGGRDKLVGLDGEDVLLGGGGKDLIRGGADEDRLEGQGGGDTLRGGRGGDTLLGGKGRDGCVGGPGRDRLRGCARHRR